MCMDETPGLEVSGSRLYPQRTLSRVSVYIVRRFELRLRGLVLGFLLLFWPSLSLTGIPGLTQNTHVGGS